MNLGVVKNRVVRFYHEFCVPFWDELIAIQKVVIVLTLIPLVPYVLKGEIFTLFSLCAAVVKGHDVNTALLTVLTAETILIIWSTTIVLQFYYRSKDKVLVLDSPFLTNSHHCLIHKRLLAPQSTSKSLEDANMLLSVMKPLNDFINNIEADEDIEQNNWDDLGDEPDDYLSMESDSEKEPVYSSLLDQLQGIDLIIPANTNN